MQFEKSQRFFPLVCQILTCSRFHLLPFLSFFLFQITLFGQSSIEWDEAYGGNSYEELQGLHQTPDGGFIYGCSTPSLPNTDISEASIGGGDYWLVKTDPDGGILWDERIGGFEAEVIQEVQPTSDGGYILGGWSYSGISADKSEANNGPVWTSDIWVVKTDAMGNVLWDRSLGGDDNEQLYHIQETLDGGFIIGGWSASGISGTKTEANQGGWDFYAIKLDASGNILWDKTFGGSAYDMMLDIDEASDGSIYMGGWSASSISGDKSEPLVAVIDYWVIKTDSNGNKIWDKTYGGDGNDQIQSLEVLNDDTVIFGGFSTSGVFGDKTVPNQGLEDMWIIKIDSSGLIIWQKAFGGSLKDVCIDIHETSAGILLFGGYSRSPVSGNKTDGTVGNHDYWIIKANSDGDKIWDEAYGGSSSDVLTNFKPTSDGGYILGGFSASTTSGDFTDSNQGFNDAWVVKLFCDITIDTIPDNIICESNTVSFDVSDDYCFGCTYLWNDGNSNATRIVSPLITTTYEVTITNSFGCTISDTTVVFVNPGLSVNLGADTSICLGDTLTLDAGNTGSNYLWSSGDTTQTISVIANGTYEVTVTDTFACSASASVNIIVQSPPVVDLGSDITLCEDQSFTLNAGNPGSTFLWSTGQTSQTIDVDTTGEYFVTVTNAIGCSSEDSIGVSMNLSPEGTIVGDTSICEGEPVTLTFDLSGVAPFDITFSANGSSTSLNNINSGQSITVAPSATTTYILESITDSNLPSCTSNPGQSITVTVNYPMTSNVTQQICEGDSIFLGGNYQNTNGIYLDTLISIGGCDSIVITDLFIAPIDETYIFSTSCNPLDTGFVVYNLSNQYSCDSIVYETTTLLPSDTTYIMLSSCNPQDTGLVVYNFNNQYSCDSIIYETTTLLPSDTTYIMLSSCNPQDTGLVVYNFNNQYFCDSIIYESTTLLLSDTTYIMLSSCNPQDTGLVVYNFNNQYSCDSIIYETTTLLLSDTTYIMLSSCSPQDTGLVVYNFNNQYSCDSIIYETTALLPSDTTYIMLSSCNPQDTGLVVYNFNNQNSCDSIVYETTTLLPSDTTYLMLSSCNPQDTGFAIYNLSNQYSCDSIVYETTTFLSSDTTYIMLSSCNPQDTGLVTNLYNNTNGCDSLVLIQTDLVLSDSTFQTAASCDINEVGETIEILQSSEGCDSVIVTMTSYLAADTTYLFATSCNPQDTGLVTNLYNNTNGCDSLVLVQTDLVLSDSTFQTAASCDINEAGETIEILQSAEGCDSVIVTMTSYLAADTTYLFATSCNPQDTGLVTDLYNNTNGCDSLVLIQTDLVLSDSTFQTAASCDINEAGETIEILQSSEGCDSVIVTMTSYLAADTTYLFATSCNPQDTGLVTDLYNNTNGCDSLVLVQTDLVLSDSTFQTAASCDINEVGETIEILQSVEGCDSVIVTMTSYLAPDTTYLFAASCNPQDTGLMVTTTNNQNGCDSFIYLQVNLLQSDTIVLFLESCNPQDSGQVIHNFINQYGCDSTVISMTTFTPFEETLFSEYTCDPEEVGSDTVWFTNIMGCDSLIINEVLLKDIDLQTSLSNISCFNKDDGVIFIDSIIGGVEPFLYSLNNNAFTQFNSFPNLPAGTYTVNVMDSEGCESSQEVILNNPTEFIINLGENIFLALGDSVGVEPISNLPVQDFIWAPTYNFTCDSCLNQIVTPMSTTVFQLTANSENGCVDTDEITIFVEKNRKVFVPNVFSPDGDGNNDRFKIYTDNSAESIETFKIFNRWGALLYEENKVAPKLMKGWDGRFKGRDVNPGVFIYFMELKYIDGRVEMVKGDVTLLR
jgi:gliding motility-associated-like protein